MSPVARRAGIVAAAFAAGAAAALLFMPQPPNPDDAAGGRVDWSLPAPSRANLGSAEAVWTSRAPWGAAPRAADPDTPEAPRLVPVGVVASGEALLAVFVGPDGAETRASAGDALPDGGQVLEVSRFRVAWRDAAGTEHEQALLADPLPQVQTQ